MCLGTFCVYQPVPSFRKVGDSVSQRPVAPFPSEHFWALYKKDTAVSLFFGKCSNDTGFRKIAADYFSET